MAKQKRSKNALKHGAFSRELILPGERGGIFAFGTERNLPCQSSCLAPLAEKTPAGLSAGHAREACQDD
jgi:hypothetical protein